MYNASYGFLFAAQTYHKTFLPQITERMNKMSNSYTFTGSFTSNMLTKTTTSLPCPNYVPFKLMLSATLPSAPYSQKKTG